MDLSTNPLPQLILLIACSLLTIAAYLAFTEIGTHYERTMVQFQDMTDTFDVTIDSDPAALQMRMRQVKASEDRAFLIMRAFNLFYAAIAGFGLSSLLLLLTAALCYARFEHAVPALFGSAICMDVFGALAMIGGATMRIREARCTLRGFREKSGYFTQKARQLVLRNSELSPDR